MSGRDSQMEPTPHSVLALPDNASGKIHEDRNFHQSEFYTHKDRGNTVTCDIKLHISCYSLLQRSSLLRLTIALALAP
jgi:hypothetical protein